MDLPSFRALARAQNVSLPAGQKNAALPSCLKNKQYNRLVWVFQSRSCFAMELLWTEPLLVFLQRTWNKRLCRDVPGFDWCMSIGNWLLVKSALLLENIVVMIYYTNHHSRSKCQFVNTLVIYRDSVASAVETLQRICPDRDGGVSTSLVAGQKAQTPAARSHTLPIEHRWGKKSEISSNPSH